MNKRILISLSVIGAVAAIAIGGTIAYFSDTETSTGNTFTAGALDLKVDSTCKYNGVEQGPCTWASTDLTNQLFFNFADVKPGDTGEDTISLTVNDNDAWLCAYVNNLANKENGCTEPEQKVDSTCGNPGDTQGELQDNIYMTIWKDTDCDNVQGGGEIVLVPNTPIDSNKGVWPLFTPGINNGAKLIGGQKTCLGVTWNVLSQTGNIIQSDSVTGDISFYAEQARNNSTFICPGSVSTQMSRLDLENKDNSWQVIVDNTYGTMVYSTNENTFYGTVTGYGLEKNAKYQITLNGPGVSCQFTDTSLGDFTNNLFQSGFWNGVGPGLVGTCSDNYQGIYNMNLIGDEYTVQTDANGNFSYPFNLNLPSGTYAGVKVLVKKTSVPFVSPWIDSAYVHTTNLFETASITFTVN